MQLLQSLELELLVTAKYVPDTQFVQMKRPVSIEYVPTAQPVHTLAPLSE